MSQTEQGAQMPGADRPHNQVDRSTFNNVGTSIEHEVKRGKYLIPIGFSIAAALTILEPIIQHVFSH